MTIKVERTGRLYSFSSVEYVVTFPNLDKTVVWSPPWSEMTDEEIDAGALEYAKQLWSSLDYKAMKRKEVEVEFCKFFGPGEVLQAFLDKHWGDEVIRECFNSFRE